MESTKIDLGDKIVVLKFKDLDSDIDTDEILKIDYSNIIGEVLTFPVLMNRIGILRAEAEEMVSKSKFELEIYHSKLSEMFRKNYSKTTTDNGGNKKVKSPTNDQIKNLVLLDEGYQIKKRAHISREKDYAIFDSLYWAAKDKSNKLDNCSISLKPEDFQNEIVEGVVNGVIIKCTKKLIR